MKLYKDINLTEEIPEVIDFGIVPAGEKKQVIVYVYNDTNALLRDLEFTVDHNEVQILKAPLEIVAKHESELILEWSPSVTLKEGLQAKLSVTGKELWG